jgi:hypothetical protein
MLPVSAWPPGPPGASLSPFGKPRQICVGSCGFVIPKGAWIVNTGSNSVVMSRPCVATSTNRARTPGTGLLPGENPPLPQFKRWKGREPPGHRPPNWFGWQFVPAPTSTLLSPGQSGLVVADGQNVVITGSGFATITQAYSV